MFDQNCLRNQRQLHEHMTVLAETTLQVFTPEFRAGESGWASEAAVDAVPPKAFLQKFLPESETFFVDSRNGMFIRGPKFGLLRAALENSRKVVKSLVRTCIEADIWMKEAATLTMDKTRDPSARPCREKQAVQVAQLAYGLAACRVV